jgi:hypothetical protein
MKTLGDVYGPHRLHEDTQTSLSTEMLLCWYLDNYATSRDGMTATQSINISSFEFLALRWCLHRQNLITRQPFRTTRRQVGLKVVGFL